MLHLMVKILHLSIHTLIRMDISVPLQFLHCDIRDTCWLITMAKWNQQFLLYDYTKYIIIYMLWCVNRLIGGSSFILWEISMKISSHDLQLSTWCNWLLEKQNVKKVLEKSVLPMRMSSWTLMYYQRTGPGRNNWIKIF